MKDILLLPDCHSLFVMNRKYFVMKKRSECDPTEEKIDELSSADWNCGFGQCVASKVCDDCTPKLHPDIRPSSRSSGYPNTIRQQIIEGC
jgi:hypothetical protein